MRGLARSGPVSRCAAQRAAGSRSWKVTDLDTDDSFQDVIVPFPACMASRDDSLRAKEPLGEGYELIFMFHDIPQVQVLPEDMPSVIFEQEDCSGTTSCAPW